MNVAVIVRSRNDIAFTKQTLDALLAQSFTDFKIVAFDNSSTDGTRQIYDEYKNIEVVDIPEGAYIPGKILNLAVALVKADFMSLIILMRFLKMNIGLKP
ncbi:MAG: glycosyltransferase family 2 protein [Opitutales bacterium]|nr:glycosyltransferase family 2 protein [Opitutales bacterium]